MKQNVQRLQQIELIRNELHKLGLENGFTDEKTLSLSQQLDIIITEIAREQKDKLK